MKQGSAPRFCETTQRIGSGEVGAGGQTQKVAEARQWLACAEPSSRRELSLCGGKSLAPRSSRDLSVENGSAFPGGPAGWIP